MITDTGLVALMVIVMPSPVQLAYQGNDKAFFTEAFPQPKISKPDHRPAALTSMTPLIAQAEARWNGVQAGRIFIDNPGDTQASVNVIRRLEHELSSVRQSIPFNGAPGQPNPTMGEHTTATPPSRGRV